jgi:hypothetical protein
MGLLTELGSPIALVKVAPLRGQINASLVLPSRQRGIGEQNLKVPRNFLLGEEGSCA